MSGEGSEGGSLQTACADREKMSRCPIMTWGDVSSLQTCTWCLCVCVCVCDGCSPAPRRDQLARGQLKKHCLLGDFLFVY